MNKIEKTLTTAVPPASCDLCALRPLRAFRSYRPDEILFIQNYRTGATSVEAGKFIVPEGSATGELYTLYSGWAFRFLTLRDGRRQILNFLMPGDFIGLHEEMADVSNHGVEALTDVQLCTFPRAGLLDLYRNHPRIGYDVTWLSAHEEAILDENMLTVGQRSARERIAMLLLHLYKRARDLGLGEENSVPFPVTQQHIADALGLSLVHTNKTLKRLQAMGFHALANGRLIMLNPTGLEKLADYYTTPLRGRPLI